MTVLSEKWGVHRPGRVAVLAGQSNARNYEPAELATCQLSSRYTPWITGEVHQGGTSITNDWQPGSPLFIALRDSLINLKTLLQPTAWPVVWWVQGENDCNDQGLADQYLGSEITLVSALEAAIGSPINWLDVLMSDALTNGTPTSRATVNAAKEAFRALAPTRRVTIVSTGCELANESGSFVHYTSAGRLLLGQRMLAAAASIGLI